MKKLLRNLALATMVFTAVSAFAFDTPANMYMVGTVTADGITPNWEPGNAIPMTKDGDTFYLDAVAFNGSPAYFHFLDVKQSSWPSTRYSAGSGTQAVTLGVPKPVQKGTSDNSFSFSGKAGQAYKVVVNCTAGTLTITESEEEVETSYPESLYVIGQVNSGDWNPNIGIQLTSSDNGHTWTGEGEITGTQFSFAEKIGSTWEEGPNKGTRYAPSSDLSVTSGTQFDIYVGGSNSSSWYVNASGIYTFNVDIENMKATVTLKEAVYPESLFVIGNIEGSTSDTWDITKGIELTSEDNGKTWTGTGTLDDLGGDAAYFAFAEFLSTDSNWTETNAGARFQPGSDTPVTVGSSTTLVVGTSGAWTLPSGTYTFSVNIEEMTFTVTSSTVVDPTPTYPTMYIVGQNINGDSCWTTTYPATSTDGTYTWSLSSLGSGFKFSDSPVGDWSAAKYNLGAGNGDAWKTLDFGQPFEYVNDSNSANIAFTDITQYLTNANVYLDTVNGTVTVTGDTNQASLTAVYVAGSFTDWETGMTDYELKVNEEGIYSGTFTINENNPEFKVVFVIGSTNAMYGAAAADATINYTENTTSYSVSLTNVNDSNITLSGWEEGNITFSVDYAEMTLTIDAKSSGVNAIEVVPAAEVIYNLQGVRVNKAEKGIYIINGKKVLVK